MEPTRGKVSLHLISNGNQYLVHGVAVGATVGNNDHNTTTLKPPYMVGQH